MKKRILSAAILLALSALTQSSIAGQSQGTMSVTFRIVREDTIEIPGHGTVSTIATTEEPTRFKITKSVDSNGAKVTTISFEP